MSDGDSNPIGPAPDVASTVEAAPEVASGHIDGDNTRPRPGSDGWAVYPSVLERYYTTHTLSNHQCVSVHSNGLCVLGMSPDHPMLQPPLTVKSVSFRSHDDKKLGEIKVSGKKKIGSHWVQPRDLICTVTASDDSETIMYACIRGSVIEANARIVEHPALLGTPEGYIAVIQPKAGEKKAIGDACLEFDAKTPFSQPSNALKRKLEGKDKPSGADGSHGDGGGGGGGGGGNGGGRGAGSTSNKKARAPAGPCWNFTRQGKCKFGEKCRFSHDSPEPPSAAAVTTSATTTIIAEVSEHAAPMDTTAPASGPRAEGSGGPHSTAVDEIDR